MLSAYLFNIYINSILECVSSNENGCILVIEKRNVQDYADVIVMFCPTSSELQELINVFTERCNEHELAINYDKTKTLKFGCPDDSAFMKHNNTVENFNQYKYIGVFMTSDLSITRNDEQVQNTFYNNVGMLNRQIHSVNLGIKLKLLNTICLPMFGRN